MPVVRIELSRVVVPLRRAHHSAAARQQVRDSILVRATAADHSEGFAECPTLSGTGYVTESTDQAWAALTGELAVAALAGRPSVLHAAPAASAALADAVLDCELRRRGVPLVDHLAELTSSQAAVAVPWTAVLAEAAGSDALGTDAASDSARPVGRALTEQASEALEAGASALKVKVHGPDGIGDAVAAVRLAGDVPVAVDANGSMTTGDLARLDDLGLAYVEQPLRAGASWEVMAGATASCRTPIALDESLVSLDALADGLRAGALRVANIKPARIGGVLAAARAADMCRSAGIDCFVGGMFELGVGRAAALAVASLSPCTLPTDLGPSERYFERDLTDPLTLDADRRMVVPHGPGCGRQPVGELVDDCLVDRVILGS